MNCALFWSSSPNRSRDISEITLYRIYLMSKSFTSKLVSGLALVALCSSMMLAPLQVHAKGGIKCGWVLVSGTPTFGTYAYLCGVKGA
jgi:hypothetical protein